MKITGFNFTAAGHRSISNTTGILVSSISIIPLYGFNSNGIPITNPNYSYIGFESGKYPHVLRPYSIDDPVVITPLNLSFNPSVDLKNIYTFGYTGNGLYITYE